MHNDASSIKYKDVKTNTIGQYYTTDNISILNVVSLSYDSLLNILSRFIFYAIHYKEKSNTTTVVCYNASSYVDHGDLNDYLNSRDDNVTILAYQNIAESIDIRLYYINKK